MPPSEESKKIAGDFHKYTETADKSLIKDIPADKLEIALLQYSHTRGSAHYLAMEMRLNELKEANRISKWSRDQKIAFWGLFVAVIALFCQMNNLEQKVQPVIEMKPQIINVNNNITRVEKEIANIKEAIHQQYASFITEVFNKEDMGKRMFANANPFNSKTDSLLSFELMNIPEANSLQITNELGMSAPAGSYYINFNIVTVRMQGMTPDSISNNMANNLYTIKYIPNTISNQKILKIKDIKPFVKDGQLYFSYE